MQTKAIILDPGGRGMYRAERGIRGDHPLMVPEGSRVAITTGETKLPPAAGPPNLEAALRSAFSPSSPAFVVMLFLALLFLVHARLSVGAQAAIGTRGK